MSQPPLLSIVIPSHRQRDRLRATLESIAVCRFPMDRLEVLVVDDASDDGSLEAAQQMRLPFQLRLFSVSYRNQSATTNHGIREARGTYTLCSAHDILFHPDLPARHLEAHRRAGAGPVVVLGALPYAEPLQYEPFLFYLTHGGYQFGYHLIRDRLHVPPNFLYAPNVSAPTALLQEMGGFDEAFPFGCQDTDLGLRLADRGVRLVYEPRAVGYHNHPENLESYVRRQETVGRALVHLEAKHPHREGGALVWDQVVVQYLAVSDAALRHARRKVAEMEAALRTDFAEYAEAWLDLLRRGGVAPGLDAEIAARWVRVSDLFEMYTRILGVPWARGYLLEAMEVHGRKWVEQRILGRLCKLQASVPARRTVRARLRELGMEDAWAMPTVADTALILTGVPSAADAVEALEPFRRHPAGITGMQVRLCLAGTADEEDLAALRQEADVFAGAALDPGALRGIGSDIRVICVQRWDRKPPEEPQRLLAMELFDRFPDLQVLTPPETPMDPGSNPEEVERPSPACCFLRPAIAAAVAEACSGITDDGRALADAVARAVRGCGGRMLAVPALAVSRDGGEAAAHAA